MVGRCDTRGQAVWEQAKCGNLCSVGRWACKVGVGADSGRLASILSVVGESQASVIRGGAGGGSELCKNFALAHEL